MAVKATFVGPTRKVQDGGTEYEEPLEFHGSIPARTLTDEDWDMLTEEQQMTVAGSPLYRLRGESDLKARVKTANEEAAAPVEESNA